MKEIQLFQDQRTRLWGVQDREGYVLYEANMPQRMAKNVLLLEQLLSTDSGDQDGDREDLNQYLTDAGSLNAETLLPILIEKIIYLQNQLSGFQRQKPVLGEKDPKLPRY